MSAIKEEFISVETPVHAPIEKVWEYYTNPEHIVHWSFASDDWESPHATNDVRKGGKFVTTMRAKDGSAEFDFAGKYTDVKKHELLAYTLDDGRIVTVLFQEIGDGVKIISNFEAEDENPLDMQRQGWQAILNNFKKYTDSH